MSANILLFWTSGYVVFLGMMYDDEKFTFKTLALYTVYPLLILGSLLWGSIQGIVIIASCIYQQIADNIYTPKGRIKRQKKKYIVKQ